MLPNIALDYLKTIIVPDIRACPGIVKRFTVKALSSIFLITFRPFYCSVRYPQKVDRMASEAVFPMLTNYNFSRFLANMKSHNNLVISELDGNYILGHALGT